ncbi:MAG: hypothetical protein IJH40_07890 [Ruminococcus sp.]|uniref:transglutaminase domain-containing protein n=1 Tax=Ruminococcus sp. TaxID=41978 RepID=UPI0028732911|nr:transglutaminase domain-containing protein [Ruminococcus sp.]MBQ3285545.1 hypothetical protein [Ruminococcus sp.]
MPNNNEQFDDICLVKKGAEPDCFVKQAPEHPENASLYAYSHISDHEKSVYNVIYDAVLNFKETAGNFPAHTKRQEVNKVLRCVYFDHPEIFWFDGKYSTNYQTDTDIVNYVDFTYFLNPDEARARQKEIDDAVAVFMKDINRNMSEYDIALSIFENIISLVDYDTLKLEKSQQLRFFYTHNLRNIYGVFVEKKAVCAGYAKAFQYLTNRMGIECSFVGGKVKDSMHAWNLIRLNGEYYYIDVTWDDHSDTKNPFFSSQEITYDYFCIDSKTLMRDHEPENTLPLPECTAKECNYYYKNGLLLNDYSYDSICAIFKSFVSKGKYEISLKATDKSAYDTIIRQLFENSQMRLILIELSDAGLDIDKNRCRYETTEERLKIKIKLYRR